MQQRSQWRRYRGQATAEMVIGLVGLTAVFFGLIQVCWLGDANIRNLIDAWGQAQDNALNNQLAAPGDYTPNWTDGSDNLRFTADDVPTQRPGGDTIVTFTDEMQSGVSMDTLVQAGLRDGFSPSQDSLVTAADLRRGSRSRSVAIQSALRPLLGIRVGQLVLQDSIYMPAYHIYDGSLQP